MNTAAGTVFYAKTGNTYRLRLVGDIRYTMGCSLDEFLDQLFKRGDFDDIVVDLNETKFIDSTNLGLLAKIANFLSDRFGKKTTLISKNEDVNYMLDSVGFDQVFTIRKDSTTDVDTEQELPTSEPCKDDLAKTLLEAHTVLSDINDKNRETFKSVVETLQQSMCDKN